MTPRPVRHNIWKDTSVRAIVSLFEYDSTRPDAPAIVICPGGSYYWHAMKTEGHEIALWLRGQGFKCYVLQYRAGTIKDFIFRHRLLTRGNRFPDMLDDIQQSLAIVRADNPRSKTGVMGFSAGGHLAAMAAIYSTVRPDFIASLYPVVTFTGECRHRRSVHGALGYGKDTRSPAALKMSLELNIPVDMCPAYLMNCVDDPVVDYHNSMLLDAALTHAGITHRYTRYDTGGHGFGVNPRKTSAQAITWKEDFLKWFKDTVE